MEPNEEEAVDQQADEFDVPFPQPDEENTSDVIVDLMNLKQAYDLQFKAKGDMSVINLRHIKRIEQATEYIKEAKYYEAAKILEIEGKCLSYHSEHIQEAMQCAILASRLVNKTSHKDESGYKNGVSITTMTEIVTCYTSKYDSRDERERLLRASGARDGEIENLLYLIDRLDRLFQNEEQVSYVSQKGWYGVSHSSFCEMAIISAELGNKKDAIRYASCALQESEKASKEYGYHSAGNWPLEKLIVNIVENSIEKVKIVDTKFLITRIGTEEGKHFAKVEIGNIESLTAGGEYFINAVDKVAELMKVKAEELEEKGKFFEAGKEYCESALIYNELGDNQNAIKCVLFAQRCYEHYQSVFCRHFILILMEKLKEENEYTSQGELVQLLRSLEATDDEIKNLLSVKDLSRLDEIEIDLHDLVAQSEKECREDDEKNLFEIAKMINRVFKF